MATTLKQLKQEHKTLEDFVLAQEQDGVWLWGTGVYEEGSVLEGQFRKVRIEAFESMKEAQEAYPDIPVGDVPCGEAVMPVSPPSWFDPMNAGEAWGEDDY